MEDPVEECSDAEAAPCTPPVAGRIAALGALSGGREDHELCQDTLPGEVAPQNLQEALDAELDEDSLPRDLDAEELLEQVEASDASQEGALAPEEWESWSRQEREMWERIRPRHVRREAQQVQSLRLPGAVVTRLMRLHPQLQAKTAEVMEVLNLATVLLLQAVVKAAARGKAPGQRTSLEDLKTACGAKELHFLQPLSSTFDSSIFTARAEVRPERPGREVPKEGQGLRFEGRENSGEVTPDEATNGADAKKRKAPALSAQKSKARRQVERPLGLDSFFKRVDAAGA